VKRPDWTPARTVYIDFETYYDSKFSLTKYPAAEYIRDPRFEELGVAVKVDEGETRWFERDEFAAWVKTVCWETTAVMSHNNTIEGLILAERHDAHPAFWFDTLGMARALNLDGSLKALAQHFEVGEKGDDLKWSKGKHRQDFTNEEFARFGLYGINDVELMKSVFEKMAGGFPESELWLIHLTTLMFTEPEYLLDEAMLREYMVEEKERKAELLRRCGLDRKSVGSNEKLARVFREFGVEPPTKVSPTTKLPVYAFAKNDVGMHALLEHEVEEVRWLAEARIAVKSTINESRGARFLELGKEGRRMPVQLNYYGAHTGRYSGGGKANFQNLERTNKKDPKKGRLKKSLLAEPGFKVVAVDSAQIEARGVAWLAEHAAMVAAFARGEDIYSTFASTIYGRKIDRKANPDDEVPGFIAKTCVLGLSYGQGGVKLAENFLKGQSGPPVQFGLKEVETMRVDLDKFLADERKMGQVDKMLSRLSPEAKLLHCAVADHLVKVYRRANRPIPALWRFLKDVLFAIEQGIEGYFGPNDCLQTAKDKIILPNGLALHYPETHLSQRKKRTKDEGDEDESDDEEWRKEGFSYFDGLRRVRIYGGKLTENVCQALARIVVTDQMLHIFAETGYRPASSTHDEWIYIAPEAEAQALKDYVIQTMKTPPAWAAGWPLNAEGGVGRSYGEAK